MTSPLEGSLATAIYNGMKGLFLDATLSHDSVAPGSPPGDDFDLAFTTTTHACKAIVELYSEMTRASGYASLSDRRIIILNQSLAVIPVPNDRITIRNATYTILEVDADPALATWTCKARV